jgi:thioredoxin 1
MRFLRRNPLAAAVGIGLLAVGGMTAILETRADPSPEGGKTVSTVSSHGRTGRRVEYADVENFAKKVLESDVPVLVDFYADWCGPCQRLGPTLEALAAETPHVKVVKVNVDDNPELAVQYRVESIPNLTVFKEGRIAAKHIGLASKAQLKAMLD